MSREASLRLNAVSRLRLTGAASVVAAVAAAVVLAPRTPAAVSPGAAASVGAYRLAGGGIASLVVSDGRLRLVEYWSGALRSLREQSRGLYVGGPGASVLSPVRVQVRLLQPGRISVDGQAGTRLPIVAQTAVYRDGSIRLVGRLLRPPGRGSFPGVVIVPGSEPAHRTTYDLWAYFFAAHGFAVLSYDKRGVGDSSGTYDRAAGTQNLSNLASDALAGLQWLRRRPGVDPRRVGLTGGSQAGWAIEIAAARSPAVRFAALQSSPAMSVGRQLAYAGLTKEGWLNPPPTPAQIQAGLATAPNSGFDPRSAIASLHIPVLWQLGGVDKRMYTPETLADLQAIESTGRHDFTVRVYPQGAHSLRSTAAGLIRQEQTSPGFVPGVFRDLAAWLHSRVGSR